ncbi:MAG: pyridoxal phosphate-dependent aminotransferase family protein [Planctomycetota bacterium]|nr:MAG: pyridoxal phosphate-dependent aminotransferase family protein [Planctomycetota bacterium]
MPDLFVKCREFVSSNRRRASTDLFQKVFGRPLPPRNSGSRVLNNGQQMLQFGSNDYLGIADHPVVHNAFVEAADEFGPAAPMGSRLLTGTTRLHLAIEEELAAFKETEAALVFSAGAMATMGVVSSLFGRDDLLLIDERAHASLHLGAQASRATVRVFRHNDLGHLEDLLRRNVDRRPVGVVVDGVCSMHGDVAPFQELRALKATYHFRLIVDDAHGTGVFGPQGKGTAFEFATSDVVDLHLGTFSKAFGTIGGFVCGPNDVITFLRYNCPTFIFTKAMPAAIAAATRAALRLVQEADAARETLWENARYLRSRLQGTEFSVGPTESPITPLVARGEEALRWCARLDSLGICTAAVTYPAVPLGTSLLRLTPTAAHSKADIDRLVEALRIVRAGDILGRLLPA